MLAAGLVRLSFSRPTATWHRDALWSASSPLSYTLTRAWSAVERHYWGCTLLPADHRHQEISISNSRRTFYTTRGWHLGDEQWRHGWLRLAPQPM